MLDRLAQALDARDLPVARRLLRDCIAQRGERDANVLMMGAVLARLEGRFDAARATLERLRRAAPREAGVAFQLGLALAAQGEHEAARAQWRATLALRPAHADAAYQLGLSLRGENDEAAGHAFLHAARQLPANLEACQQALECAARLALATSTAPALPPAAEGIDDESLVSFIVCSIDPRRLARLRGDLESHFADSAWELVHIPDARSLCEGYNRGAAQARGDWLVFCHDDVRFFAPDLRVRLLAHLRAHDVIGVAGTTRLTGPAALWSGVPDAHGWVIYPQEDGAAMATLCGTRGPVVSGAQALDGAFIATRRACYERLRFDETTFDGFDLYDLDFSYRAHRAGLRVAICQDLLVEHASLGGFGAAWAGYAARFLDKFPELGHHEAAPTHAFRVAVPDARAACRAYGWIAHWCAALDQGRLP